MAMDWLGSPSWAMDWLASASLAMDWLGSPFWAWIGEGPSLSRPGFGRHHLSWRRAISPWDRTISPCVRCALIEPRVPFHVHSLAALTLSGFFM